MEIKQTENGVELHELFCTDETRVGTYPDTFILTGETAAGDGAAFIFTALDGIKTDSIKDLLSDNFQTVEVYKLSKDAFTRLFKEYKGLRQTAVYYDSLKDRLSCLNEEYEDCI